MQSPNFGDRRDGLTPELIVIHYTAMASCAAALDRLCDPAAEVSAHYLIDTDGTVLAVVPEDKRAWHAGAGTWGGRGDINSRSVGIELANDGATPFAAAQMNALEGVLAGVMNRWGIGPAGVIGHSDMAPDRKGDPGARFDWRRLALAGLSVWPDNMADDLPDDMPDVSPGAAEPGQPRDFIAAAGRFGYPAGDAELILRAFRLRFRPWAVGPMDRWDVVMVANLARRFPAA